VLLDRHQHVQAELMVMMHENATNGVRRSVSIGSREDEIVRR
jgi:hypothetical protein